MESAPPETAATTVSPLDKSPCLRIVSLIRRIISISEMIIKAGCAQDKTIAFAENKKARAYHARAFASVFQGFFSVLRSFLCRANMYFMILSLVVSSRSVYLTATS